MKCASIILFIAALVLLWLACLTNNIKVVFTIASESIIKKEYY